MSRKRTTAHNNVGYHKLQNYEDEFVGTQFIKPKQEIPFKAIFLAAVLCIGGFILLISGCMLITGYIDSKYADRTWPLILLGSIMFLPGAYHIRIAIYAYKQYPGYSFDDIPEFN